MTYHTHDSRSSHFFAISVLSALALLLFSLTASAMAGLPAHLYNESLELEGFNRACGVSVDSEGNVYVASAGESKIRIFDDAQTELGFISNANEPCGLAVDTNGNLYVSERALGKVVKYHPTAYPFVGPPTYGAPTTIDASGAAKGISVDPVDNNLYVAEGNRIDMYNPGGTLGIDEAQRVLIGSLATGGTFTLSFKGQQTGPLSVNASHAEVQSALAGLSTIGPGNVSVTEGKFGAEDHTVTFTGALAATDVELLQVDISAVTGGGNVYVEGVTNGFSGHIGAGDLTDATGVAAYTYKASASNLDRYLFAADAATNQVKLYSGPDVRALKLRKSIAGPKAGEDFGFGTSGAYLAVDPGNRGGDDKCDPVADQACTAGHLLIYDESHKAVDEFDATGEFLDQIKDPAFADAQPTAIAVDRSGGSNDGTIYVTAGAAAAAKLLAFGPLTPPSRPPLPSPLSRVLAGASAVATDSHGDVYVRAGALIHVFDPTGAEIKVGPTGKGIEDPNNPSDLAVDSTGKVYVLDDGDGFNGDFKVTYYTPSAYPPVSGTTYARHEPPIDTQDDSAIAVNPANDHVFITTPSDTHELDSAANGSVLLNADFASNLALGYRQSIAIDGASGNVYFANAGNNSLISVVNAAGTEVLARIDGAGSPEGTFGVSPYIAVDQSNGHVLEFQAGSAAREYDASGGFVAEFGEFTQVVRSSQIAIDNACTLHNPPLTAATTPTCKQFDPSNGNVYVAFDDTAPNTFDLTAFGPLAYGEPPVAVTGIASGVGAGNATLNGTVDPRGFDLEDCHFEYLTDATYLSNVRTFAGATSKPCAESLAAIGNGAGAVPVHADLTGLDPETRYRFRLVAENRYGESPGDPGLFGPPVPTARTALPILYTEATLRAEVDPSGLPTTYHFEYVDDATFQADQPDGFANAAATPSAQIPASDGPVAIEAPLTGLQEGTTYHFRIVAENEAKSVPGPDQAFATLARAPAQVCPNLEYRTGLSAHLPDCRAYELVTPAETNGLSPRAVNSLKPGAGFNNWLTPPGGATAGERLTYFIAGTLPGFDGTGILDGYRARRGVGEHPTEGWNSELVGPGFEEAAPDNAHVPGQQGVSSDQLYSFWSIDPAETFPGTLEGGVYLRTSSGFEPVGQGNLGIDLNAESSYVAPGGGHVIFSSDAQLEEDAPLPGTVAVYDRSAGSKAARVISLLPGNLTPSEDGTYVAATEDGTSVLFRVGGTLYLRRGEVTTEVATGPNFFAGISEDGRRVFFAATESVTPTGNPTATALYACDTEAGPCVGGPEQPGLGEIAPESFFVNIAPDGSAALFVSEEAFAGSGTNELGETALAESPNLYAWEADTGVTAFVGRLDPQDFVSFKGSLSVTLDAWSRAINPGQNTGRANAPTRSTPTGGSFVFQSHAKLTAYENGGHGEIYRYAPSAPLGARLICVSCDPSGAPPGGDAMLAPSSLDGVDETTTIPNITDNGQAVFFHSGDRLLPEDANGAVDVYEWMVSGSGGCERQSGCLALISSGQGEKDSFLYSMSADGHDVFFLTKEKLVGQDIPGSPSLYDARVNGGIPDPPAAAPCQGDACKPLASAAPLLPVAGADTRSSGNGAPAEKPRCAKGKRKVRRNGKTRCVKKHQKRKRSHRANGNRRAAR